MIDKRGLVIAGRANVNQEQQQMILLRMSTFG